MIELYHVQAVAKAKKITSQKALTFIRRQRIAYYRLEAKRLAAISKQVKGA